ncbi:MAG TPA: hypothetical protein ACFYDZ_00335 [Candidatus Brocadiaceae bacterium]
MAKDLFASNDTSTPRAPRDLFENTSSEPESFLGKLLPNIGVGLTHAGRNLHNLPHDIVSSLEKSIQGIGSAFDVLPGMPRKRQNISNYIPKDTADYQNVFRNPGENTPTDYVVQKSFEYGPDVLMGLNALRGMKLLPYLARRGASRNLQKAREIGREKNIAPLEVNPDLIEDTRQFFPNTTPYRNLINDAGYGDYNRLFDLQSDLGKHAGGLSKDWFSKANRAHGRAGLQVRGNILDEMKQSLRKEGHEDIADLLTRGQDDYRRYMKFKPYRNALAIAGGAYALPKNALIDLFKKLVMMKPD